ncbi:hypothetical protein T492DRAFT_941210, partial [Pavlovales sp. CCMP2436]
MELDGGASEPLLENHLLPPLKLRPSRSTSKSRSRHRLPGSHESDDDDDDGEGTDTVGTELPGLPPIAASYSAPVMPTVSPDPTVSLSTVALPGAQSSLNVMALDRAPRSALKQGRPNPWESSNRKTFKPIITIGKTGGAPPPGSAGRKRTLSLPFGQLRRSLAIPERYVIPPLFSADASSAFRCGTLCVGSAIDVKEVYQHYSALGMQCTAYKDGLNVVVHCLHHNADEDSDSHAFYFMYGSIVLWNFDKYQEARLIAETRALFSRGTLDEPESEDFGYIYIALDGVNKPHISKDIINLTTTDVMEKLAVSFGLAQSSKLSVFEHNTESTIASTRHIPEQLAATGHISLSRNEISRRVGQLFVDRSQVNLHSDMLDTPAFFWDEAEWEPLYQRTAKYMEIEKRVSVLNHRLDIIADLFDMLASEMHEKHASNLEIIVIVL